MKKLMISLMLAVIVALGIIGFYCWKRNAYVSPQTTIALADLNALMLEYAALGTPADLQILVDRGADIEAKDADGQSAFMIAVAAQNLKNAQWLLAHGANINATAYNHSTSLLLAIEDHRYEAISFLVKQGIDLNLQDDMGNTALILAVLRKQDAVALELIDAKADIERQDGTGATALSWAISKSNRTLTKRLLGAGANLDLITTPEIKTPLFFHAVIQDDIEILKMVLATKRVPLNAVNIANENALIRCLMIEIQQLGSSKISFARLLIDAGINVNQQTTAGLSPLMIAVALGNYDLVKQLLKHGAKVDLKDRDGNTALMYCDSKKYPRIHQLLKQQKFQYLFRKQ